MGLTGRFNFRKTLTGKLVLQVETERRPWWPFGRTGTGRGWRDAVLSDLAAVELQALLNLRNNPGYTPRSPVVFMMNPARRAGEAAETPKTESKNETKGEVVALASHRASAG